MPTGAGLTIKVVYLLLAAVAVLASVEVLAAGTTVRHAGILLDG